MLQLTYTIIEGGIFRSYYTVPIFCAANYIYILAFAIAEFNNKTAVWKNARLADVAEFEWG
jgi:hypothetical protein